MPRDIISQAAVIPFREGKQGELQIALITNRSGSAWIIPKGIIDAGEEPHESAARECIEEAGLVGEVSDQVIGSFSYEKWGACCEVEVYLLRVITEHETWEEKSFRDRAWFTIKAAANTVREREVARMIRSLPELIRGRS